MTQQTERCSVMVCPPDRWGAFFQRRCERKPTVERDGKLYCPIHDPVARDARDEARYQKYLKQSKRREAQVYAQQIGLQIVIGFNIEFVEQNVSKIRRYIKSIGGTSA